MAKSQPAHVKGELIRWARESVSFSIDLAAESIGVKPEVLAEWEAGSRKPSIARLRKASEVFRIPLAAFFLPEPPKGFQVDHDFRRVPGETPKAFSRKLITELRRAHSRRDIAIEFADEIPSGIGELIGSTKTKSNPENVAAAVRKNLGITLEEQFSWENSYQALNRWKEAIERLGVLVFHFNRVAVREARGFSISDQAFPVIGVNSGDLPNGRIFTLLHEFCHLLLARGGSCDLREHGAPRSPNQRIEAFCNRFAGSLLVPMDSLLRDTSHDAPPSVRDWNDWEVKALARRYCVSEEVILRRLMIIGLADEELYRRRRAMFVDKDYSAQEKKGGFTPPHRKAVRTVGQPFARIVINAYYQRRMSWSELADFLEVRTQRVPEIEGLLSGPNTLTGGDE